MKKSDKIILIDGVRFELWTPQKEVEEFHPLVKEHYKEIFGENSIFIDGSRLESEAGKGSVPDGFVITFGNNVQWYIVEIELSTHHLYDHIVNQVGRFINGIRNTETQKKIIEVVYHYVQGNKKIKAESEEAIGSGEIYKFLTDLLTKPPVLAIIIEERTTELDESLDLLRYSPINVVEFRTFTREGADSVHAHLFEPLYKLDTKGPNITGGTGEVSQGIKVAAGDFNHKGDGIFTLKSNPTITINARKHHRLVNEQLNKQGFWTKSLGNFCYDLRKKAGLLNTPPED